MAFAMRDSSWPADLDERARLDIGRKPRCGAAVKPIRPPLQSPAVVAARKAEAAAERSATALQETQRAVHEQRQLIAGLQEALMKLGQTLHPVWSRACWVCGAAAECQHREPELRGMWR